MIHRDSMNPWPTQAIRSLYLLPFDLRPANGHPGSHTVFPRMGRKEYDEVTVTKTSTVWF